MQSMLVKAVRMYRYIRTEAVQDDGQAVAEYPQGSQYLISIRPLRRGSTALEQGDVPTAPYTAWVNDTHDFEAGDRIGTATDQLYEVVTVLDNLTGQNLELTAL